jgi:hypothetical protein
MNLTATEEATYLRVLSIAHYVLGGLAFLFGCFPIIHLVVGIGMLSGSLPFPTPREGHGMPAGFATTMGTMFVVMATSFILIAWAVAGLIVANGRFLVQRKHHTFCVVVGFVEALFAPFGTVLGIFTIVLLMRDSVRKTFAGDAIDASSSPTERAS